MIVLDANILIRAVLGRRVRQLVDTYASRGFRFVTPDVAFVDAETYLPPLQKKRGKPDADVLQSLEYLKQIIEPINPDFYGEFESEARERLRGRDEDDWPVLATALGFDCDIGSEDQDFFGTGVAVWTTSRIEIFLNTADGKGTRRGVNLSYSCGAWNQSFLARFQILGFGDDLSSRQIRSYGSL